MLYHNPYVKQGGRQPVQPPHPYSYPVTTRPATIRSAAQTRVVRPQQEAVKAVRSENRTLISIVAFFALWMVIAVVFLLGYMFQYLF